MPRHPADEGTADQSTPTSSGPAGGKPEGARDEEEDLIARNRKERNSTPRRYEEGTDDPAMPSDDSSLNTKI